MDGRNGRGARGFTLIEILVTLAVIAVLVAILLPALHHARALGRLQTCVGNVRQQSVAVEAYADDFREAMPPRSTRITGTDGGGAFSSQTWMINRFLAGYGGEDADDEGRLWTPMGAWRCVDVRPEDDGDRYTDEGILHFAPNGWAFNALSVDQDSDTTTIWADMLPAWVARYTNGSWRRLADFRRTSGIIELMDNVNYYFAPHMHRHARDRYSYAIHAAHAASPDTFDPPLPDNQGSHDDLERRPAAFLDGHGEAVPSSTTYWLGARHYYRAGATPDEGGQTLYDREVERLMWFIEPGSVEPAQ